MCNVLRLSSFGRDVAMLLLALLILAVPLAASAVAQTTGAPPAPTAPPATTQPPSAESLKNWRSGMRRVPLPKKGCFTSSYPSGEWHEVPCTTAPARPYPPARGARPDTVGNGNDVSAQVSGLISVAVGSFDSVVGVTSESGVVNGSGSQVPNTFSLQLNANFFSTSACNGGGSPDCLGWQQFVYSNAGWLFMQYWLLDYAATCPSGWYSYGSDCYVNSTSVSVPVQTITNLGNMSLTGEANSGGTDTIIFSTGSTLYSVQAPDSVVDLAQGWQQAEFNIVGDCCASQANFNSGSTIVVRTSVNHASPQAPTCYGTGFTGETNNLYFATPSGAAAKEMLPAIVFTEGSTASATSACSSAINVPATGIPHDLNGDGKSDIAWQQNTGILAAWLMNGAQISQAGGLGAVTSSWQMVGQHDFNGDGMADLLWRDGSGNLAIWYMNGLAVSSTASLGNVPVTWAVSGTGDLNADGKGDLLWRDGSGNIAVWFMNGSQVASSASLGNVPTTWTIVADDSKGNIFWRDSSGNLAVWHLSGSQITASAGLGNVPANWVIAGIGDFNGDGSSDILWRDNNSHAVAIWLLDGMQILSAVGLGVVPSTWTIAQTGDYNGDGMSDILWVDSSGNVAIWFMNGTTVASSAGAGNVGTTWAVQAQNAQ